MCWRVLKSAERFSFAGALRSEGRGMLVWIAVAAVATCLVSGGADTQPAGAMTPKITSNTDWLQMPKGKILGDVSAVAVDAQDNLWILHRPKSLAEDIRMQAASPIIMFDPGGRFVRDFGGPAENYEWPAKEHSLAVDSRGHVWVGGSYRADQSKADDMILEFDGKGSFIKQLGRRGASKGNFDVANLHAPADIYLDDASKEVFVADGYGNRRVIVFDSGSGEFKRMWGAFGEAPPGEPAPAPRLDGAPFIPETGEGPHAFNSLHGVELSRDGLVYVGDRNNQRIQVFTKDGTYVQQFFVNRNMSSPRTVSGIAMSADPEQRYLYVSDWGNNELLIYDRKNLRLLGKFGGAGSAPCRFSGPHLIATDSHGVLYVAEVQGRRVQRLEFGAE